jgi:hypothetical protein
MEKGAREDAKAEINEAIHQGKVESFIWVTRWRGEDWGE